MIRQDLNHSFTMIRAMLRIYKFWFEQSNESTSDFFKKQKKKKKKIFYCNGILKNDTKVTHDYF